MKHLTLFPFHNYKIKLIGIAISCIAMILMLLERMVPFSIIKTLNHTQNFQLFFLITSIGLYILAFSKEKVEDERVLVIRGKAYQIGFGFLLSTIIAISFISITFPAIRIDVALDLPLIIIITLFVYLLFFNIGLYKDPQWLTNKEVVSLSIGKNKIFFIAYFIILIAVLAFLIF